MNIVGVGAAFCMGCCPNIRNGAAIAVHAVWVSPPMITDLRHMQFQSRRKHGRRSWGVFLGVPIPRDLTKLSVIPVNFFAYLRTM